MKDTQKIQEELRAEAGLEVQEARLYLEILEKGEVPVKMKGQAGVLLQKGMVIVSGDGKRLIPVHPRLGIANQYRTWRERVVREINERRMRVDRLILELIPLYESATEKRAETGGQKDE